MKELDLEAQVMFFKDISNDLKNALVSKSNIFVMPSIIHKKSVEGFGIAYVEAAQYGVPSIGGKDGGAEDAIDHEKIVMALRNLKQIYPDIVYICVGYGEEEENIKKLVKELDLEAQVMFFKDISNDLKNALVSKSNIFVMPSIMHKKSVEGFGIAYVEAAQYGIPSIGGKDGGAADAIDHEKTGFICDGNSLDEVYSSINSMLKNKNYLDLKV